MRHRPRSPSFPTTLLSPHLRNGGGHSEEACTARRREHEMRPQQGATSYSTECPHQTLVFSHMRHRPLPIHVYLLARIEDTVGVEDIFDFAEQSVHFGPEHLLHIGTPD